MRNRKITLASATVPVRLDTADDGTASDGMPGVEFGMQAGSADIVYAGSAAECVQGATTVATLVAGKSAVFVFVPGEQCWALPATGAGPVTIECVTTGVKPNA